VPKRTIHDDVQAALKRLDAEEPGLKRELKKAYGYAVFPSVGKAALLLGGAWGRGEVYQRGKVIGYATIAQTTLGVQIGGDTFTEVLLFDSKEPLERFKQGKTAFTANASAVLIKAGAAGTKDFEKGVKAYVHGEGGMLLEAAIGGQRFHFQSTEDSPEQGESSGSQEQEKGSNGEEGGLMSTTVGELKNVASKTTGLVKEHPVAASLLGAVAVAGGAWWLISTLRNKQGEASNEDESDEQEDQDNSAEDSAQDQDEESQEDDEEQDDQENEEEESPHLSAAHGRR